MFKQIAIVLSINKYSFKDDKTNREISGCTMYYILAENLAPYTDEKGSGKGYKPAKATLPLEAYDKVLEVPGFYELHFALKVSSDGKPQMVLVDLDFTSVLS